MNNTMKLSFIPLAILFSGNIFAQDCLPSASYPFDGDANDYSGNGYHGTLFAGATVASGFLETAYNDDDYLSLPVEVLDGVGDFTISFDFFINSFNTTGSSPTNTLIAGSSATAEDEFAISYQESITAIVVALNGEGEIFETDLIEEETWYCLTVRREGEDVSVFIDAALIGTIPINNGALDIHFLEIGQELDCPDGCFALNQCLNGAIDNLLVYDCITAATSCEPYFAPCDTFALYPFGGDVNDLSGNGYNGTLFGDASVAAGYLTLGYNTTDYVELPVEVLNGAGDFAVSLNFMITEFNESGSSPTNTIMAGINSSDEGEFAISYERSSLGFEIALNDVGGVLPADIDINTWYCLIVYRKGADVWATVDGDSLPGVLSLPVGDLEIEFLEIGQELDCVAGCFALNQCLNGAVDELIFTNCFDDVRCSQFPNGVKELGAGGNIHIYPNPANDVIYIEFDAEFSNSYMLICDMNGKQVFESTGMNSNQSISTNNWVEGIYMITLTDLNTGKRLNSKFIKQ